MNIRRWRVPVWVLLLCMLGGWSAFYACNPSAPCQDGSEQGKCVAEQSPQEKPSVEPSKEKTKTPEPQLEPSVEPTPEPSVERVKEASPEPQKEAKSEPSLEPTPEPVVEDAGTPPEPVIDSSGPEPTVQIVQPKDGSVVTDTMDVEVQASVAAGAKLDRIELRVDGNLVHQWTKAPYTFKLNTTAYKDQLHTLSATAFTDLGKSKKHEVKITTANAGPQIKIVSPKASASVTGAFTIEVSVTSPHGIKNDSVKLEIDGAPVAWTQKTPSYKATFDPKAKPFDSFPIWVTAEDTKGKKQTHEIWVIHDPAAGPVVAGQECDNADPKKRCQAGYSCLLLSGAKKAICRKHCTVGGPKCASLPGGVTYVCRVAFQGTTRGACVEGPPAPGQLFSACGDLRQQKCTVDKDCDKTERCLQNACVVPCFAGLICVGARKRPDGTLISFCLKRCTTPNTACTGQAGFTCVGLQGGGGACIEQCGQKCTADTDCSRGQVCKGGSCAAPFCREYGQCMSLQGIPSKLCI